MHFNPEANAKLFLVIIDWGCINVYYAVLSTSVMSPLTMLTDTKKHTMTLIKKQDSILWRRKLPEDAT